MTCPVAKTSDDYANEAINSLETGLIAAIQTEVPKIPALSQDPQIEAPLLLQVYFDNMIDYSQKWDWSTVHSFYDVLLLATSLYPNLNNT